MYFLQTKYSDLDLTALDIDDELVKSALKKVPSIKNYFIDNITNQNLNIGTYDIIFMLGVHSIFDDLNWIKNINKLMKNDDSVAYIFGMFNQYDIDVLIKSKDSPNGKHWEKGWNNFSKKSISFESKKNGLGCDFTDFEIGIDIPERADDKLRTWTINLKDNKRLIINGLGLIQNFSLCKLYKL